MKSCCLVLLHAYGPFYVHNVPLNWYWRCEHLRDLNMKNPFHFLTSFGVNVGHKICDLALKLFKDFWFRFKNQTTRSNFKTFSILTSEKLFTKWKNKRKCKVFHLLPPSTFLLGASQLNGLWMKLLQLEDKILFDSFSIKIVCLASLLLFRSAFWWSSICSRH